MNIHGEFSYVPDDYYEFHRASLKHTRALTPPSQRGFKSPNALLWLSVALILVITCFNSLVFTSTPATTLPASAPAPMPPGEAFRTLAPYGLLLLLVWGWYLWTRSAKSIYRRLALQVIRLNEPRTIDITDDGITIREPTATTQYQWRHFIHFVEMHTTFILFVMPRTAQIIPKRAFKSEADLAEFRAFAQYHFSNQPSGFPIQPPPVQPAQPAREA